MCGICGFVTRREIQLDELKTMNNTMFHRGPDDSGEEIYDLSGGYHLGMAQRRLAILDLSAMGHQPMHSKDQRVSVVFNGEIYNFRELKKELGDYSFVSNCDTEVIIAAYLKWGIDCIKKMHGMFAIALFDRKTEELFLIRDRIGKKPLYYWLDKDNIVFASELKPIMQCPGFEKKIRKDILARYLYQQYITSPDSIFENVFKLAPGTILCFSRAEYTLSKYWDVQECYHQQKQLNSLGYQESKEQLKDKLRLAVQKRMISDVPLGSFLSGGYDSSLITAIAQELSDTPLKTFTIGFRDEKYNEAHYAKSVAEYLGTDHTEVYIDEKDMLDMVQSLPYYYDEPFADSSQIPSMLVSKIAKEKVTVTLSGDGGDEFFCGYNVYKMLEQAQRLNGIGKIIHGVINLPGIKQMQLAQHLPLKVRTIVNNQDADMQTQLTSDYYIELAQKMCGEHQIPCRYFEENRYGEKNWQERRMLLDMETYLPEDILCKIDRAGMKYSLETRCPILDTDVMEYAYSLLHSYKYNKGIKKRILKDITYDYIPQKLLERPKKGFSVPMDKWLHGPLKEELLDLSGEDFLQQQEIFETKAVREFLTKYLQNEDCGAGSGKNYSRIVWAYYVFQKWYAQYIIL